jgi:hypothetical protein
VIISATLVIENDDADSAQQEAEDCFPELDTIQVLEIEPGKFEVQLEAEGDNDDRDDYNYRVGLDKWARAYDELNGAPENDDDR